MDYHRDQKLGQLPPYGSDESLGVQSSQPAPPSVEPQPAGMNKHSFTPLRATRGVNSNGTAEFASNSLPLGGAYKSNLHESESLSQVG